VGDFINEGDTQFNAAYYDLALFNYERAIQISPGYAAAWYGKGNVLGKMGKYEDALSSYSKSIEIDPSNVAA
jgi:tetratricopeptide (TPR) repeat protein